MVAPFDDSDIVESERDRLSIGSQVNALREADSGFARHASTLSRKTGVPAQIIDRDTLPIVAAKAAQATVAEAFRRFPAMGPVLATPHLYDRVADDIENVGPVMQGIEFAREAMERAQTEQKEVIRKRFVQPGNGYVGQMLGSVARRAIGIAAGAQQSLGAGFEAVGATDVAARYRSDSALNRMFANFENPYQTTWSGVKDNWLLAPKYGIEQFINSLPDMAAVWFALPAYVAARSGEIGQERAENNGRTDADMMDVLTAAPAATASALLDRLGLRGIGAGIRTRSVRGFVQGGSAEALTEGLQSGIENVGATAGTERGFDVAEMGEQMLAGAVGGLFGGGVVGGLGGVANGVYESRVARETIKHVDGVMGAAAKSKTRTESPDDFREMLEQQLRGRVGEDIHIPVEAVQTLFQSVEEDVGPGIADDPFWSRYAEQIAEAQATGGDVVVPFADLATHLAGTTQWDAIRDHVRLSAAGMSLSEAREYQKKGVQEDLERIAEGLAGEIDEKLPTLQAERLIATLAVQMGRPKEEAAVLAKVFGAKLIRDTEVLNAKRAARGEKPLTPAQMLEQQGLVVARGEATAGVAQPKGAAPVETVAQPDQPKDDEAEVARMVPALVTLVKRRGASLRPSAIAETLGIPEDQARKALAALAARPNSGLFIARSGNVRRLPVRRGPVRLATFLADRGGIVNDPSHALTVRSKKTSQKGPRGGGRDWHLRFRGLVRKNGRSLDDALELAVEAGYFPTRTRADYSVADLIDAIEENRLPIDAGMEDSGAASENEQFEADAREEIAAAAEGLELTDDDVEAAIAYIARGETAETAVSLAMDDAAARSLYESADDSGDDFYESRAETIYEGRQPERRDRGFEEGDDGSESFGGDAAERPAAASEPGSSDGESFNQDQLDAFGTRPSDVREWLERLSEGRKKSDKKQKAPGSDGGLFDENAPQDSLFQEKRGSISFQRDERGFVVGALIRAFKSANFSTFVHEMGHYWVEDLRTRAMREDATDRERADWEAVKAWFAENGNPVDEQQMIPVEAHELWARGTERYVMEGRAPSEALAAAFRQMAQWMKELYRTVSQLRAPITPEIRDVMDRMLATDEEITIVRERLSAKPMEGVTELMSEAERVSYEKLAVNARDEAYTRLLERMMQMVRARRTREYNQQKRTVRGEVEAEVDAIPVMRLMKAIREGLRIPRQWIVDAYGEEMLRRLPGGIQALYAEEGADPESMAEDHGFTSSDQMMTALTDYAATKAALKASGDKRSPRAALIAERVRERVEAEIGDPYNDIENEARAAIANDSLTELMSMEARALARKTGRRPTPWQAAVEFAKRRIAIEKNRDAISGAAIQRHARAVAKSGKQAGEACIRGDFEEALRFKQQQMLSGALLSEAKKARDKVEVAVRRLKRVASARTIKSVDQDYLDQAHSLLMGVNMDTVSNKALDQFKTFERWHAEQVAQGREPIVPPEYRALMGNVNWSELTVAELIELDQVVAQVISLGRHAKGITDGLVRRDYEIVRGEAVAQLQSLRQRKRSNLMDESKSWWLTKKSGLRGLDAAMMKIEVLCDWFDANNSNGLFNRLIFKKIADAQAAKTRLAADYDGRLAALMDAAPVKTKRRWSQKVDTPELLNRKSGEPFEMTMDQILLIAMNMGNEGNRQRLIDGYGWNEGAVEAALDRLMTAEDWTFVQGAWDMIDTLWPAVAEMERRVNGFAPEKIEATPVETRHGTFRGGYFPAVYDHTKSAIAERHLEQDLFAPTYSRATTRASSTNERVNRVERPILLSMSVLTRHLDDVIHDLTHREAVIEVNKLISDPHIIEGISDAFGPEYAKVLRPWLKDVANEGVDSAILNSAPEKIIRALRTRVTMVGLGFRVMSAVAQLAGTPNIVGEIGLARMTQGVGHSLGLLARGRNPFRFVTERSGEMAARFSNVDRDVREELRSQAGKQGLLGAPFRFVARHAYDLIMAMDAVITTAGWTGAYDKALSEGMKEGQAVYYADKVIRLSQGAGATKDQVRLLMEGGEGRRLFTMFFSYFSALYGRQRDIAHRARNIQSFGDVYETARRTWWIAMVAPIVDGVIRGEKPDEDDEESWFGWGWRKIVFSNMASLPGVRDVTGAIHSGYGYSASPIQSVGENVIRGWGDIEDAFDEEGEVSSVWLKRMVTMFGIAFKQPTGNAGAAAQFGLDVYEGDEEPETVGDWWEGLTTGRLEYETDYEAPMLPIAAE